MIAMLLASALVAGDQPPATAEAALAKLRGLTAVAIATCVDASDEEIVVCGRRSGDGYRLPATDAIADGAVAGEVPSSSPNRFTAGGCGILAGQRKCSSQAEIDEWMGGGKNPLTVLRMLGTRLLDPDADTAPPPDYPRPR